MPISMCICRVSLHIHNLEEPFESHIYTTHRKLETAGAQSTTFTCQTCGCEELSTEKDYFSHTYQHLRQYKNVTCMFEGCAFQTKIYGTFKSHKIRKHNPILRQV